MEVDWSIIIAFLALFVSPTSAFIGYYFSRKKSDAEIRLLDAQTIEQARLTREKLEGQINELSDELHKEQEARRADRDNFARQLENLKREYEAKLRLLRKRLSVYEDLLKRNNIKLPEGLEDINGPSN